MNAPVTCETLPASTDLLAPRPHAATVPARARGTTAGIGQRLRSRAFNAIFLGYTFLFVLSAYPLLLWPSRRPIARASTPSGSATGGSPLGVGASTRSRGVVRKSVTRSAPMSRRSSSSARFRALRLDDHRTARRHLGLGPEDVEGRQRAQLEGPLVLLVRVLRQVERLL